MESYTTFLNEKCKSWIPTKDKANSMKRIREKKSEKETTHIAFNDHDSLFHNGFQIKDLKAAAKHYKLKVSGNKDELTFRLFRFLKLSVFSVRIQRVFRGNMVRRCLKLQGPGLTKRALCTNPTDFLSMEPVEEIPVEQFFSFRDEDGFIYGYNLTSLYNLCLKSPRDQPLKNPYNRNTIPARVIMDMKHYIRLCRVLGQKLEVVWDNPMTEISPEKSIELRVLELFQTIDSLGNYSNPMWFHSLNRGQLVRMMVELKDIWFYRAQLSPQVKREICPPYGDLFHAITIQTFVNEQNMDVIKRAILPVLERLVNTGVDTDSRTLGAYYVLGALTLVSAAAAEALPWLYQSLFHF
jgi:hypothetical protein